MEPKVILFDIEASGFDADFDTIHCVSYKYLGEKKIHTIAINDFPRFKKDPNDDYDVVKKIGEVLSADNVAMWCAHYGSKYDVPFIQTRLLKHGLPLLPDKIIFADTWRVAKSRLKLSSNRLKALTEFLGFEDKTPLKRETWNTAARGTIPQRLKVLPEIIEHCEQDVKVLEGVYMKLRPLMTKYLNHSLINGEFSCPKCKSSHLQKRGFHYTLSGKKQRYMCLECFGWSLATKAEVLK